MKLPFLKTNTTPSQPSGQEKNNLLNQVSNYLQNESNPISGLVTITYIFTTTHGRNGDKFAAKLAENGDAVHYFVNKDKKYQIAGTTKKLKCNENEISRILTDKIEMAIKYNCALTEWNIQKVI